ncbi:hypothetical protein CAPTEDRAFT_167732 [Capitella teleta]|uniref:Major facilitator superfamily (MFS) profile domain-containing protein n=1 Tax=Capitella teleta TaxID=283909 RepID=R7UDG9_CAPTE|nr:hypothetical protein CAPTEDRAFT_167732 [Capitella teleta]|eukprot:ELU04156.1 hypothetical protein CAPTEDRAFT_167732 [Capitella teleta]
MRISVHSRTIAACTMILGSVIFERIAFYSIVSNLVMFLNQDPLHWMSYNAVMALFVFTGLSYMTALFGGWIADSILGKFKTIVLFFFVYIGGYVCMPLLHPYPNPSSKPQEAPQWCSQSNLSLNSSGDNIPWTPIDGNRYRAPYEETCAWLVWLGLGIMAIGNGGVKANIAPFGADQVKMLGSTSTRGFFNWFYWSINLGALVALGLFAFVQQELSFFWGYVVPGMLLCVGTILFICGFCFYVMKPPSGSILSNIVKIIFQGCRLSARNKKITTSSSSGVHSMDPPEGCLDRAKLRFGGSFHDNCVDDVRSLGRVLLVFLAIIPYWIVYFQMETTFIVQGLHMKLDFDKNDSKKSQEITTFKLPAAWLSLFDIIFLIVLIPLMDRVVYPALDRRGHHLSLRGRIFIGMIFGVFAVGCAGGLESWRMHIYWLNGTENVHWQEIGNTYYRAAGINILWQIPQYTLIGVSEVFASVASLELAYSTAPKSMQGIIMGLFWFTQGLGSILGTLLTLAFHNVWFFDWDEGDINCQQCHLDYYFFFLAGVQFLGAFAFYGISCKLKIGGSIPIRHHTNSGGSEVFGSTPTLDADDDASVQYGSTRPPGVRQDSVASNNSASIPVM